MNKWDILIYLVIISLLLWDIKGYTHEQSQAKFCLSHIKCVDPSMKPVWINDSGENTSFVVTKGLNTLNVS